jgi:hypothetical protein
MKFFVVRRGQELEAAKTLLEFAKESMLSYAQDASAESERVISKREEADQRFEERRAEMQAAHQRRMVHMGAQAVTLDTQVSEVTDQAERVDDALTLLA